MSQIEEAKRILRDVLDGRTSSDHPKILLYGSLDTTDYLKEDGERVYHVKCRNCHILLKYEDGDYKPNDLRSHREGCPIADVEEFLRSYG